MLHGDCKYEHLGSGYPCDGTADFLLVRHAIEKPVCASAAKFIFIIGQGRCMTCRKSRWTHETLIPLAQIEATA